MFPQPVKRFENYYKYTNRAWWTGYCPGCNKFIAYNFLEDNKDNRLQYCWRCGQLCDFTDK